MKISFEPLKNGLGTLLGLSWTPLGTLLGELLGSKMGAQKGTKRDLKGTRCPNGSLDGLGDVSGTILDPFWEAFRSLRASLRDLLGAPGRHLCSLGEDLWVPCAFFHFSMHFLPTFSPLPLSFLPTFSPLPPRFLPTFSPFRPYFFSTFSPFSPHFLITFSQLSPNFLATFFQLSPHSPPTLSRYLLLRRLSSCDALQLLGAIPKILHLHPEFQRASRSQL